MAVDVGVGRSEGDLSRVRVDQPVVFVVGLVGQRVRDLLQIEAAQVQHTARIDLSRCPHSRTGAREQRQKRISSQANSALVGRRWAVFRTAVAALNHGRWTGGRMASSV